MSSEEANMSAIIELAQVNKVYRGTVDFQALFDINLSFTAGSSGAIVGVSGSGKTTLLNILGTFDSPTSGKVVIDGKLASNMTRNQLARLRNETIGFVFQFHHLLPEFTALENVLIPHLINRWRPSREVLKRADELFDMLEIADVKHSPTTRMSGGQQQRTAIARALINNPKIVIADEPTGNLDSETTEKVCYGFREINRRYGTTFIVVTHNHLVAGYADRIVELKDGRVVSDTISDIPNE
jgi:lipoprotein-releasing system ATP-binding protein